MWTEGISEKHFWIKDVDINCNFKHTEVMQPLERKTIFFVEEKNIYKKTKTKDLNLNNHYSYT